MARDGPDPRQHGEQEEDVEEKGDEKDGERPRQLVFNQEDRRQEARGPESCSKEGNAHQICKQDGVDEEGFGEESGSEETDGQEGLGEEEASSQEARGEGGKEANGKEENFAKEGHGKKDLRKEGHA